MNRINMRNEARRFIRIMFGTTCCALAYRCFLSPAGLFNGGFTGIAQIIRNVIQSLTGHTFHSDPTGIIVWCLNVPLMIYGYKELGRMFMIRTIFAITFQSLLMTLIPTPEKQLVTDAAVNCLAGGALNGFGIGTLLSQGGRSGGTDIVGLLGVKRRPEFSVGRISMFINICICIYAAITRDFEVAIYSACYSMLSGFVVDRAHRQNVRQTVYFVSEKPKIGKYINRAMGRGVTSWEVVGEYSGKKRHMNVIIMNKYEMHRFRLLMEEVDPKAFIWVENPQSVYGKFRQKLGV